MAVLVTGGAGYIGSHMVHELLDAGEQVVVLDNLSTGFDWAVAKKASLVKGDIADRALVESAITQHAITAIIHFAGSIVVPDSMSDPLSYYRNNTINSHALIATAVKCGIKHLIFSSSAAIYGNPAMVPVTEDEPTVPVSPYGSSKLMTEIMLQDTARAHDLRYVILRYFNVAGADPLLRTGQSTRGATHLIKVAAEVACGLRPKMDIFGINYPTPDGTCIRDYIHVSDLASAHSDALRYLRSGGTSLTLNCGYGRGFSVREVIEAMKRISGVNFRTDIAPPRAGDPAQIVAASDRIRSLIGWQPRYDDLSAIITHALAWQRKLMAG